MFFTIKQQSLYGDLLDYCQTDSWFLYSQISENNMQFLCNFYKLMRSPTQTITDLFDVEIRCVAALQMNLNDPFYIYVSTTARLRRVYFSLYIMYKMNKFCHFNGDFKGFLPEIQPPQACRRRYIYRKNLKVVF